MGNSLKLNNLLHLLFIFFIFVALSGCRITGGSRGNAKSDGTIKTSYITDEKSAPIILGIDTPRVRFKVDNLSQLGSYKKDFVVWRTSMSMSVIQKRSDVTLDVSVYNSDGTAIETAKFRRKFIPNPSSKSRFIWDFSTSIYPEKLAQHSICNASKKSCNKSFIVEIKLVDGELEQAVKINAKSKLSVRHKCATWILCTRPKEIDAIKVSTKIIK